MIPLLFEIILKMAESVPLVERALGSLSSGMPVHADPLRAKSDPEFIDHIGLTTRSPAVGFQKAYSFVIRPSGRSKSSATRFDTGGRAVEVVEDVEVEVVEDVEVVVVDSTVVPGILPPLSAKP